MQLVLGAAEFTVYAQLSTDNDTAQRVFELIHTARFLAAQAPHSGE